FGVGRTVDRDDICETRPILDPLRRAPSGKCCKLEGDPGRPEPRPPQIKPGGKTGLRVDVERGNPSALSRPCDGELCREGRLAGAALALRDRNHQPRHSIALADVDGQGHPFGRLTRNETPTPPTIPVAGLVPATHV